MRITYALSAVILSLILQGCQGPAKTEPPRPVRTMTAVLGAYDELPLMTGSINAHTSMRAAFRASGRISGRTVSVGDTVSKDRLLATLDDTIAKDALRSAEAAVAEARAAFTQAERNRKRLAKLYKIHSVSQLEDENAEQLLKTARARFASAKASLHSAEEQLSFTRLQAAVDGVIVERLAESGEVVQAGQAVFIIAGHDGLDAVFDLPPSMLASISVGTEMDVLLDRDRTVRSKAVIEEISPEADRLTRTHRVKAHMKDPSSMPLGSTVVGRVIREGAESVLIPASALAGTKDRPAVWKVDMASGQVRLCPVVIGNYTRDMAVVTAGIARGDVIVTAGVHVLREGQKVEAKADAAR